jgi:hypothetical protein
MQCVNLTDDELWRRIAQNTTVMSVLVYRRIELDAGNTRNDIIERTQLMQSNLETIIKLEHKYRECTDELRRRYPAPDVITVTEVEETRQVSGAGQRDCAEMREGQGIMNVLRSLWAAARQLRDVRSNEPRASRARVLIKALGVSSRASVPEHE